MRSEIRDPKAERRPKKDPSTKHQDPGKLQIPSFKGVAFELRFFDLGVLSGLRSYLNADSFRSGAWRLVFLWILVLGAWILSPPFLLAQPKSELATPPPLDPAEGERQARALVVNLLAQKPEQGATNTGVARIRDRDDKQREIPMRFEIFPTPTNWCNVYEAAAIGTEPAEKLTIVHTDGQANQYFLGPVSGPGANNASKLCGNELMVPFAGSDFWVVDLGLEFLHWPQQRVLKKQMRRSLFCDVLQSVNPQPAAGGYARVLSWIAVNRTDDIVVVHAEAYDASGKLLKEFDPKRIQKINGVWQLEEMEIRNRQTGSRTWIEFNLGQ
jgi:hypothetical protein